MGWEMSLSLGNGYCDPVCNKSKNDRDKKNYMFIHLDGVASGNPLLP
jgi:hypothetical protein